MTDIVERLRFRADENYEMLGNIHEPLLEAAAEISRLRAAIGETLLEREDARAEVERLRAGGCARDQGTTQYCAEAAKLAAENERLRAALELFACDCIESGNLCPSPQNCRNYIARTALGAANDQA